MAHSDPTLQALYMAVEASPDNVDLRVAYSDALIRNQLQVEALEQAQTILSRRPDYIPALRIAHQAATLLGQEVLSQSYQRMIDALTPNSAENLLNDFADKDFHFPSRGDDVELLTHNAEIPADSIFEVVKSDLTLADIAGLESVKRRIWLSFLGPLKDEKIRSLFKKSLNGGLLLYGPPGCGKTMVGKSLAGELGASFINVGIHDVLDMFIGGSENKIHDLFVYARSKSPCVLFFDELDALGRKRSLTRDHAGRSAVNQLLSELDGVASQNEGLYIVAATNHPWDVDSALRRPGRFDRTVLVLPPDLPARIALLTKEVNQRPNKNIDIGWIAKNSDAFSGADLVHLIDSAAELAMEEALTSGNFREIEMKDFKTALKEVKPSTRTWMETARNYAVYSNEGGIYDDLLTYMKSQKMI